MKILVLGSKGQLGCCLFDQLSNTEYEVAYLSRDDFDMSDFISLKKNITTFNPDFVINASAYTAVDKAETDIQKADLINHLAVSKLADTCKDLKSWLIHISTDYVFDGCGNIPYLEKNKTNPKSIYGKSKLNGEKSIQASGCKYIIIRTSWVFSEYGNNFLKTMLQLAAKHKELSIVNDQIGCPTYAQDIAKGIMLMLPSLVINKSSSGIFNFCGHKPCSWYEFAIFIFKEANRRGYKTPSIIKKVTSDEFKTIAPRPRYSVLDCSRIKKEFGINPSNWDQGVSSSLKSLDINKYNLKIE
ncbi:dTDP-4-dehydrorhamnose reductase [Gammaproteobacteria bacterium]|nr:dTDP-4-dehydrorhamnose reductase [Gammaproteobacteria bacterium]